MARMREKLAWKPEWNKDIQKWTECFIRNNRWRCDSIFDKDDLIQEAYLVFDKVVKTYPRVANQKHFFSLYRRAMINKMHDRASKKQRIDKAFISLPADLNEFFISRVGETNNAGYVGALLNEAPEELRIVLDYLARNGLATGRHRGKRENLSRQLCRRLGLPLSIDPMAQLKQLLTT